MLRPRFPLDSDLLELLLAFEDSQGLNQLAEKMAKDPSVISRRLQQIAETYPLLAKVKGRWELTPLGRETNKLTRETTERYQTLMKPAKAVTALRLPEKAALIIINAQIGLLDATQAGRSNSEAEQNIARLLKVWRIQKRPVIHVKHVSNNPQSAFFRASKGVDFLPEFIPAGAETVLEKTKSSAFAETALSDLLRDQDISDLVLAGFTANDCIDSTARDAAEQAFTNYVVGDATAMFDLRDSNGKLMKAERLQRLTMANLNAFYAKVVSTDDVLS